MSKACVLYELKNEVITLEGKQWLKTEGSFRKGFVIYGRLSHEIKFDAGLQSTPALFPQTTC